MHLKGTPVDYTKIKIFLKLAKSHDPSYNLSTTNPSHYWGSSKSEMEHAQQSITCVPNHNETRWKKKIIQSNHEIDEFIR